ncbi:MAG: response regulator, partial [Gluconacetobacter diazotrophicus]|nr:response regulator [Gluconacetobacter diazotrophicus]
GPRIEYVNGAFTRMTGYGIDEIVGQTPRILQGPKTDRELIKRLRNDLTTQESFHGETVNYRKDGAEYVVEWRITPLHDAAGNLSKWVAIQRNVTDRVHAQEERERVFKAEHAARLEGERVSRLKDEFLATLSHELRTPLNAILGWANVLKDAEAQANVTEVAQAVEVIERNARAQVQLIEDLLDMSRIISGKARLEIDSLSLARIIAEAVESVRHAAELKGITIVEATDPLAPPIYGDASRLRQVFWNLLSNAIKFTPRNGRIEVRQVQAPHADGEAEVTVRDSGQGIPEDFLPYVFDRFRQSDASASRRQGGLGLGLSIVKQLVELHGGTARVTSAGAGKGATFTVSLPVGEAPSAVKSPPVMAVRDARLPSEAAPATHGHDGSAAVHDGHVRGGALNGVRLLLVEDDADQRYLLRRVLEQQGANVRVADDADAALEMLRVQPPHVLISDIGLPGMDGYEFLRRVRELPATDGGRTPAVALTAFARAEDRQLALRAGFQTHVTKPAEAAELINVIANLASLAK